MDQAAFHEMKCTIYLLLSFSKLVRWKEKKEEMKSKLYVSKEYFRSSPDKSGFAMMKDGEVFFYQIEQQEGLELDCKNWADLREVAHIETEDVLVYKEMTSLSEVTISSDELFMQLVAKYDTEKPIIHKTGLKGNGVY
jgi:hypothetical protein